MRQLVGQITRLPGASADNAILIARAMGRRRCSTMTASACADWCWKKALQFHVSIVARALGIPAVGEVPNAPGIADPAMPSSSTAPRRDLCPSLAEIESATPSGCGSRAAAAQYLALRDRLRHKDASGSN